MKSVLEAVLDLGDTIPKEGRYLILGLEEGAGEVKIANEFLQLPFQLRQYEAKMIELISIGK